MTQRITSPDDASLAKLCGQLSKLATETDRHGFWPGEQLRRCGEAGVFEWFLPVELGGQGWEEEAITRGYVALAEACLSTTFILTQRVGACRRIAAGENDELRNQLIPPLLTAEAFATVGISHLTTSRRHLGQPSLTAERDDLGFQLHGLAPWVTGGERADTVVVGAEVTEEGTPTGEQVMVALATNLPGVSTPRSFEMVALSSSMTGPVQIDQVFVPHDAVVAGPMPEVLKHGSAGRPGGPQTSALAVGAASASMALLAQEASRRPDLVAAHDALADEHDKLLADLLAAARGTPTCEVGELRQRSNSHVLRASQAALTATKGAGYLAEAPAGRYCREALFFLVWSCPQPVQNANLCELAGLAN